MEKLFLAPLFLPIWVKRWNDRKLTLNIYYEPRQMWSQSRLSVGGGLAKVLVQSLECSITFGGRKLPRMCFVFLSPLCLLSRSRPPSSAKKSINFNTLAKVLVFFIVFLLFLCASPSRNENLTRNFYCGYGKSFFLRLYIASNKFSSFFFRLTPLIPTSRLSFI